MKTFMQFVQNQNPLSAAASAKEVLQEILAMLRAQHWLYYNAHWQTQGANFYEQHLLFERLYGSLPGEFDSLAEKLVAYFGSDAVNAVENMKKSQNWVNKWAKENLIEACIEAEKDLQRALQHGYDKLKQADDITLGLDDYLMATANAHETNLYLLTRTKKD